MIVKPIQLVSLIDTILIVTSHSMARYSFQSCVYNDDVMLISVCWLLSVCYLLEIASAMVAATTT